MRYSRLIFFVAGICTAMIVCFIVRQYRVTDKDSESMKMNNISEIIKDDNASNLGRIPDSIKDMTEWVSVSTKRVNNYYRKGDFVYWSDAYINQNDEYVPKISGADANTFMIDIGSQYAKDQNNVYWWEYDEDVLEYDEWPAGHYSPVEIIKGADSRTFRSLGSGFACDKNTMYFRGRKIEWDNRFFDPDVTKRVANLYWRFYFDNICDYIDKMGVSF